MEDPDRRASTSENRIPAQEGDVSVTRARQAVAPHIVRYVLGVGLVLAVVALGLTLAFGGL